MDTLTGKKIVYLVTQSKYGGAQKYILQLAHHFAQHNDVRIVVGEKKNQDPLFFAEARNLGIEPMVLDNLIRDVSLVKAFDAVLEIRRLLVKERPDVLHLNSSMAGAIGACAAWFYGFDPLNKLMRVIYTVHGFVFNEPLPRRKKLLYLLAEKISASWKHAFIMVSRYDKDLGLKRKIAPERRMSVIHNGIDLNQHFLSRDEARQALAIDRASPFMIGTIASLYKTKGLEYLLGALAVLKKKNTAIHCSIIGDGPERSALIDLSKKLGLNEYMHFLGARDHAPQYLKAFDLFVLPSIKEGCPYTIIEAGLASLPVIASNVGGIPELISHQTSGLLVEPAQETELARAIEHLADQSEIRKKYARALHLEVLKNFSSETMLRKTEELYLSMFQRPTSSKS